MMTSLINAFNLSLTIQLYFLLFEAMHSKRIMSLTSRELHKSAQYLRLKNSKMTSKCQVFSFTVPKKPKSWTELARGPFRIFKIEKYCVAK